MTFRLETGLVSRAIENAQTKVEGHNFDIRKHVLQYDEVVNEQRNRIYDPAAPYPNRAIAQNFG